MRSSIKIRKLTLNDLEKIFNLGNKVFSDKNSTIHKWNEKNIAEVLSKSLNLSFIAARRNQIIGFIIGEISENRENLTILWLGITKRLEKKGIEEQLLHSFEKEGSKLGIKNISIELLSSSNTLIDDFKKNGFIETEKIVSLQRKIRYKEQ